ncbi:uncharacterized protein K452DRAFT_256367 [Aplosporella prunicola CBS 121167]|uniref:Cytochrome P450 n=1 Tax=Aplosporella prunicola CBS 121167 TaxID=1176127 RepID=A0A6A6B238_9PEZI|nr:uncharacterized protein K452DRAFT_256367 [Aplosporella prunicola CBS 121167]KAF2138249.1 hypothetical protein K452DRAFT_256367 [Aplosporella prunicola CBS 121167]
MTPLQGPSLAGLTVAACLSGVLLHHCVFIRIELENYPCSIAGVFLIVHLLLFVLLYSSPVYMDADLYTASSLTSSVCLGLYASIMVYRAFYHALSRFPGPYSAKLTKFWSVGKAYSSNFRWHQVCKELHNKYGDYVRVGPRELSVIDPEAIVPILNLSLKGPFYGSLEKSIHTTRDAAFHKARRKVWDNAFKESLPDYGIRIEKFTNSFVSRVRDGEGQPMDINELATYFSYDVMSALAFGEALGFVDGCSSELAKKVINGIRSGLNAIGMMVHVPYIMTAVEVFSKLPGPNPMKNYNNWSKENVVRRKKMKNPKPDIMGHLIKNTKPGGEGDALLDAESRLIIGAGSETTATAISLAFTYLALNPSYIDKLREESGSANDCSGKFFLYPLPVLDSIVNEVLRLHPPITFGSQRVTSSKGLRIGHTWIPPETVVAIPPCVIGRDPRNYVSPNDFIPERWTTRPDLLLNRGAFIPFSMGRYSCPGKTLAMMELRSVISRVIREFDVFFPEGQEWSQEKLTAEIKDHFTTQVPRVDVIFRRAA